MNSPFYQDPHHPDHQAVFDKVKSWFELEDGQKTAFQSSHQKADVSLCPGLERDYAKAVQERDKAKAALDLREAEYSQAQTATSQAGDSALNELYELAGSAAEWIFTRGKVRRQIIVQLVQKEREKQGKKRATLQELGDRINAIKDYASALINETKAESTRDTAKSVHENSARKANDLLLDLESNGCRLYSKS